MTTNPTPTEQDETLRCLKCGHDAFNGRYCEADDPTFQARCVPCGCKCRFSRVEAIKIDHQQQGETHHG